MTSRMMRACSAGRDDRRRRIGAHAAGVGSLIAVVAALVVLRGGERQHLAVGCDDDEARLPRRLQEFLDDDACAGGAEACRRTCRGRLDRRVMRLADHDALAGREAVGLDHQGSALRPDEAGIEAAARERARSRRSVCGAAAKNPWRKPSIPPAGRPPGSARSTRARGREAIDDAGHQGSFGSDDGQTRSPRAAAKPSKRVDVVGRDVDVAGASARAPCRRCRAPRTPAARAAMRAFPGQRMFAPAAADYQDLHACSPEPNGGSGASGEHHGDAVLVRRAR